MKKKLFLPALMIGVLFLGGTCKKVVEVESYKTPAEWPKPSEPITANLTDIDRGPNPPPPDIPWWTIDTANLSPCKDKLWGYLKNVYPLGNDNLWEYDTYGLIGDTNNFQERVLFDQKWIYFFHDTVLHQMLNSSDQLCNDIDSTFFLQALGNPTMISYNETDVNYFYYYKRLLRNGPCAFILEGLPYDDRKYNPDHFNYCGMLHLTFSKEKGDLFNIFYAP